MQTFTVSIILVIASTLTSAQYGDYDDYNDEELVIPEFELDPIVDFFEKEIDPPPTTVGPTEESEEWTDDYDTGNAIDLLHIERLRSKFLRGPDRKELPANATSEEYYIYLSHMMDEEIESVVRELLPYALETYEEERLNVSAKCANAVFNFGRGLQAKSTWALKFLDSMGKLPMGLLEGTLTNLGNFDQCLAIEVRGVDEENAFDGKYCVMHVRVPMPPRRPGLKFQDVVLNYTHTELNNTFFTHWSTFVHDFYSYPFSLGICVPSICAADEMEVVLKEYLARYNMTAKIGPNCYTREPSRWTQFPFISITILCLITILVLVATLHDLRTRNELKHHFFVKLLHCFSGVRNWDKLMGKVRPLESNYPAEVDQLQRLNAIDAIKFLALVWLVITDVYLYGGMPLFNMTKNLNTDFRGRGGNILFQFILNGWGLISEIFFFTSGLMLTLKTLTSLKRNETISLWSFLFNGWLRFVTSIFGVFMLTFVAFSPYFGSGPIFGENSQKLFRNCENNWWSTLLLINNWSSPETICLPQTWFLSVNFQLCVIGFLVVNLLYLRPMEGQITTLVLIVFGIVGPAFTTIYFHLPPAVLLNEPYIGQMMSDSRLLLFPTHHHFSSYFLAVLIGYRIFNRREVKDEEKPKGKSIRMISQLTFLLFLCLLSFSSAIVTFQWNGLQTLPTIVGSIVYAAFHRIMWISPMVWLIYLIATCSEITSSPGINNLPVRLNQILYDPIITIVSKLTTEIYLLNFLVIWYLYFTIRNVIDYRDFELLLISGGIFITSIALGCGSYLLFRAPLNEVCALLYQKKLILLLNKNQTIDNNENELRWYKTKPQIEESSSTIDTNSREPPPNSKEDKNEMPMVSSC